MYQSLVIINFPLPSSKAHEYISIMKEGVIWRCFYLGLSLTCPGRDFLGSALRIITIRLKGKKNMQLNQSKETDGLGRIPLSLESDD